MSDEPDHAELRRRITDLEVRLEWQDRTIHELDEVVRTYSDRVDALERELARLRDELRGPETGPHDDEPPHY